MFCQGCGKEISDDTRFCPSCGRPTDSSIVQPSPQQKIAPTGPKSSNNKLLLIIGIAIIAILVIVIVALSIKGKSKANNTSAESASSGISAVEEQDEPSEQEDSILKDYVGDWHRAGDVWGGAYADQYEVPMYMRIEPEGISAFASGPEQDSTGAGTGEKVFFGIGTDKISVYEDNGRTYYEFHAELYAGPGNGRKDTGIRLYYDNDADLLVGELFTQEDGYWQRRMKFERIDSINEDRASRHVPINPSLDK